jgi:hypothetical protein
MRQPRVASRRSQASVLELFQPLETRQFFSGGFVTLPDAPGFAGVSASADFDNDGDADVATISGFPSFVRLDILRNDGAGTLSEWQHFNFNTSLGLPLSVAATDFDNDGDTDVVAFGFRLFRNNAGTFGNAEVLLAGAAEGSYFLADHNADNLPDIFFQAASNGAVTRHTNSGGTSVAAGESVPSPMGAGLRAVVDMNGDNAPDMVFTDTHAVTYAASGATYTPGTAFNAGFTTPPVVADLNDDARPDLVWGNGQLRTSLNDGTGNFAAAVASGAASWLTVGAVGDFDADGLLDVLGIRNVSGNRVVTVSFATQAGQFDTGVTTIYTYQAVAELDPHLYTAQLNVDTRSDVFIVRRFDITPLQGFMSLYRSTFGAPQITSFTGPNDPFIPGRTLTLNAVTSPGKAGAVTSLNVYRDSNGNGVYDNGVDVLAGAATSGGANTWVFSRLTGDVGVGSVRYFAVATDEGDVSSDAASFDVTFWTRISYPEGWRNDATINEYVPMVNPNSFPVQFRLLAHYETGERDAVIAEGTIPAFSRGGVTISEHANPDGAIVRLNEGYALELQSSAFIGAMLSHYDSFSGENGVSSATGEAFTNTTSTDWYFADASTADAAFIIFFNPSDVAVDLDITFYHDVNAPVTFQQQIQPLRRSGLALRNPFFGLQADSNYAVRLSSTSPIIAALSSYSTTDGSGFSSLGRPVSPDGATGFPVIEYRDTTQNSLVLFNTSDNNDVATTVQITYAGVNAAPTVLNLSLDSRGRQVVDLNANRPDGATSASVRVTGAGIRSHVESVDATRGDSSVAAPAARAFTVWAFADGFLDSNTAGTVGFETIGLYNPGAQATNVRVRYLFNDGTFADRFVNVASGASGRVQLDQDDLILNHGQLNFYSIMVYADTPVVASMIHWDLFQGGGWASLGTPGGTPGGV